ncbi:hypothetical protein [Microvirga yunnanensis]|uniref:hypothetical protein n=1 Tax=Microvirga yunnanensis TaxID=2953740 RepID=UPI0021C65CA2|nr:hypothetical protein [Microvirga sp. HBU67655]
MVQECKITKPDLKRRVARGQTVPQIAAETGFSQDQIRRAFRRHGLTPVSARREPAVPREEFIALVSGTTMPLSEIAEKIGVSLQAVLHRARALGLKTSLRDRGAISRMPKKITDEQLRQAAAEGRSNAQIAKAYGMSGAAVWKRRQALEQPQGATANH